MLQSMTGYASRIKEIAGLGKITIEIKSSNHKFLEILFHAPEYLMPFEGKMKKSIEGSLSRGRVVCAVNILGRPNEKVFINKELLNNYHQALKEMKKEFSLNDSVSLDTLIKLPGVLTLKEESVSTEKIFRELKTIANTVISDLLENRKREGGALKIYLSRRAHALKKELGFLKSRFKKAINARVKKFSTPEEKASFLKTSDISEEIERLSFHIKNFLHKLDKKVPVGKELDFIAQEMQRETNTIGAKSCDVFLSARVVQIKSQIEKIREQVQNVE